MKNPPPIDGRNPGGSQEIDQRIDATLRLLARVEPPAGLAARVEAALSRASNETRSGRGPLRLRIARSRIAASGIAASLVAGGLVAGIAFHSRQAAAPPPVVRIAPKTARPSTGMSTSGLIRPASPPVQAAMVPHATAKARRQQATSGPVRRNGALPRGIAVPRTPNPSDAAQQNPEPPSPREP